METKTTKWFVFGVAFGMGTLLIALHLSPTLGPKTARADEHTATEELTKVLKHLTELVDAQLADEPTGDARESALNSDIQTVRSQIELYKIQHLDALPGTVPGLTIVDQLTMTTDVSGKTDVVGAFGPYLCSFPKNPYTGTNTVNTAGPTNAWYYDPKTGKFTADNVPINDD